MSEVKGEETAYEIVKEWESKGTPVEERINKAFKVLTIAQKELCNPSQPIPSAYSGEPNFLAYRDAHAKKAYVSVSVAMDLLLNII